MRFTTSDGLPDASAFAVVAKVVAGAENANTSALQCALRATGTGTMIDESLATSPASGSRSVLVMQGPVKTGTGVTGVDVVCSASGGVGPQGIALLATLSLIQVASVTGP